MLREILQHAMGEKCFGGAWKGSTLFHPKDRRRLGETRESAHLQSQQARAVFAESEALGLGTRDRDKSVRRRD